MCEAHVYFDNNGELVELMKNVISITPQADGRLMLVDLFGEQKMVEAKLKDVRLLDHKVILEKA